MPMSALMPSATVTSFDPMTLLPALAAVTEHIGLLATASTTYNDPYHVARKFASLDHLSGGRAGWNIVTSANPDEAKNFGQEAHLEHDERYRKGREFYEVVTALWDSWDDDAFLRDAESGLYFDPDRLYPVAHEGEYYTLHGALNVARPVQGWPVIVQAGASEVGRQFAAEVAELVFGASSDLESGRRYYAGLKGRMQRAGRNPDHLKVLPGCFVVVGDSEAEAREKKERLDALVHPDSGIATLSVLLGVDASGFELDAPLPKMPATNASQSSRAKLTQLSRDEGKTVRQLAQRVGGSFGVLEMVGTPGQVADQMEAWLHGGACDGFNIMSPYLPGGLDEFAERVVPELQRRGIFRTEYEGTTLRENLGLPRPANRNASPEPARRRA